MEALGIDDAGLFSGLFPTQHVHPQETVHVTPSQRAAYNLKVALIGLLPIPGAGSTIPYFYIPLVVHLILRDWIITAIFALIWVYCDAAIYFFFRAWSVPVPWPVYPNHHHATYDLLAAQVIVWNPLSAFFGILTAVFSIDVFGLEKLRNCDVCWELIVQAIIFFIVAVKQGEWTAWCVHNFVVPIVALGGFAVWNGGYDSYDDFAPYLFWMLMTWYLGAAWLFSNLLIHAHTTHVKDRVFLWSIQGTYGWTVFFTITAYIFVASIYKFIVESS